MFDHYRLISKCHFLKNHLFLYRSYDKILRLFQSIYRHWQLGILRRLPNWQNLLRLLPHIQFFPSIVQLWSISIIRRKSHLQTSGLSCLCQSTTHGYVHQYYRGRVKSIAMCRFFLSLGVLTVFVQLKHL